MFPEGVVHLIADSLYPDKQALAQSSSVCRLWQRPFQTRLFSCVRVSSRPKGSFEELIQFLSSHRDLGAYINTLQLGHTLVSKHTPPEAPEGLPCSILDPPTLSTILSLTPALLCLKLDRVSLANPFQPVNPHVQVAANTVPQIAPRFSLDTLSVVNCHNDGCQSLAFEDLRALLSIFHHIRSFRFHRFLFFFGPWYRIPPSSLPEALPGSGPNICHVEIKLGQFVSLIHADDDVTTLAGIFVHPDTLRALEVPSMFWWNKGTTKALFGRRLESLTLHYPPRISGSQHEILDSSAFPL